MASRESRVEKVKRIFDQFDKNKDGGLNTEEMSSLVVSVNPKVQFSDEQINAILEEVFKTYNDFIDVDRGLTFDGLLRTYEDGAGDVDRDFDALKLELISDTTSHAEASSSSSVTDDRIAELPKKQNWVLSPSHEIVFGSTWKIVEDLEMLVKRLRGKQLKDGRLKVKGDDFDSFSEPGWSTEFRPSVEFSERRVVWDVSGQDYNAFVKKLGILRGRADGVKLSEEMFDGHMAIAELLYEHHLFKKTLMKPAKGNGVGDVKKDFFVVELSKFKLVSEETTSREELANALEIRVFQRITRLGFCDVKLLKKEISKTTVLVSHSHNFGPKKSIQKSALEEILHRLLHFLQPETFQGAVKSINKRILSLLDYLDSSNVDLGMFYVVLAPICSTPL